MSEIRCRLLVLGAGPGGYVCAIRAGQLGVDTVVVDARKPGGTCLNVGCIPSKALIHAAEEYDRLRAFAAGSSPLGIAAAEPRLDLARTMAWKDEIVARLSGGVEKLLGRSGARLVAGTGRFVDGKTLRVETQEGTVTVRAETVVIATGSRPVELPSLPCGDDVISSSQALSLPAVPGRLAVIGGGYIGLEIGSAYAKLGARVTVVEAMEDILPQYDGDLTRPVARRLGRLGVKVMTGTRALAFDGGRLAVETDAGDRHEVACDKVLVAVGRKPLTEGWGLEELRLAMDGPFLRIDDTCRTSMRGVFAIGDVTGEPMLAHRAMAQGQMVAEIVAGRSRRWDKRCIPAVCFTDPEIVSVGLSPEQAKAEGFETKVGIFRFRANGRALTTGDEEGFVRVTCRADNHLVLGIQAVGAGISEMASAFALAVETACVAEDIVGTVHAHPTRGEALAEACLSALGAALHA